MGYRRTDGSPFCSKKQLGTYQRFIQLNSQALANFI